MVRFGERGQRPPTSGVDSPHLRTEAMAFGVSVSWPWALTDGHPQILGVVQVLLDLWSASECRPCGITMQPAHAGSRRRLPFSQFLG